MKKVFNLAVIFAALMATATFTSCGDDDEAAVVDIQVEAMTSSNGVNLFGVIMSDNKLDDIVILNSAGETAETIALDPQKVKEEGLKYFIYEIDVELPFDAYTIKATDDNANESTKALGEKLTLNMGDATSANYGSFLSIKDGAVYTVSQVNAGKAANVEIIYKDGALLSADEATNANVVAAGNSADLTAIAGGYYYSTSTGFSGAIMTTVGSAEISLIVFKYEEIAEIIVE